MKALSIRQPWADLILAGAKDVENRTWWTSHRGRLAIHASKTPDEDYARLLVEAIVKNGYLAKHHDCLFGVVLGTVELVDVVRISFSPWWNEESPWAWELANPVRFEHPLIWPGRLRLFDVPDDAIELATRGSVEQAMIDAVSDAASTRRPGEEDAGL